MQQYIKRNDWEWEDKSQENTGNSSFTIPSMTTVLRSIYDGCCKIYSIFEQIVNMMWAIYGYTSPALPLSTYMTETCGSSIIAHTTLGCRYLIYFQAVSKTNLVINSQQKI